MKTIKLENRQLIKIPGSAWCDEITFQLDFYKPNPKFPKTTLAVWNERNKTTNGILAFSCNPGCALVANYPGRDAEVARKKIAFENAPLVEDGDVIEVEGYDQKFVARINGVEYSDPARFEIQ